MKTTVRQPQPMGSGSFFSLIAFFGGRGVEADEEDALFGVSEAGAGVAFDEVLLTVEQDGLGFP